MVVWMLPCVTLGSVAPGVHRASGRPLLVAQLSDFLRLGASHCSGGFLASDGGSMLSPVQPMMPKLVKAQCVEPSVNVGVLVLLRQKARPTDVSWSVSPLPFGSAYSHEMASPMA